MNLSLKISTKNETIPLLITGMFVFSCKKDEEKEDPSTMTATIDGATWSATNFAYDLLGTTTVVVGWTGEDYLSFTLLNTTTTGTYDISIATQSTGAFSRDGQTTYYISRQGYVNISEYSTSRVKGTFEFLAVKTGTIDTILVDNGVFDVSRNE